MKTFVKKGIAVLLGALLCVQISAFVGCNKAPDGPETYAVTAEAVGGGRLSASDERVEVGGAVTFTAYPDKGNVLERLEINGGTVATVNGTYTVVGVLRDLAAKAYFAKPEVTIEGYIGDELVMTAAGRIDTAIGQLPTPMVKGKRLLYWTYEDGRQAVPTDYIETAGTLKLTAVTEDITDEYAAQLTPFSLTSSYFDAAATKYGAVFHTAVEPVNPVAQIVECPQTGEPDWSNARNVTAESEVWMREYVNTCVIDGLAFDTAYAVRLGDYAADAWSDVYTFTTRKAAIDATEFFFVSDSQQSSHASTLGKTNGYDRRRGQYIGDDKTYYSELLRAAIDKFPEAQFILHGGDYVEYGGASDFWQDMLRTVENYLFDLPTMVVSGNHEGQYYATGDGNIYFQMVNKMFNIDSPNVEAPNLGEYYSFDYGPAHFVCLRSEDTTYYGGPFGDAQLRWLESDLAKVDRNVTPWVIAVAHQAVITAEYAYNSHVSADTVYSGVLPLLDKYGVDLFLNGHNHSLEISNPLVWDETENGTTVEYNGGKSFTYEHVVPAAYTAGTATVDGDEVKTFTYADGYRGKRGTVFHQVANAGPQYLYLRDPQYDLSYDIADLSANIAKTNGLFNCLLTTGAIDKDGKIYNTMTGEGDLDRYKGYSMYSYIEIENGSLTCRSYGVDVYGQVWDETDAPLADFTVYAGGFRLTK